MRISKSAAVIASLVLSAGTASAQATWNNSFGGIWSDNMNWDTGSAPLVAGDSAIFPNLGMAYEVICNVNPTIDSVTINGPTQQLTIGDGKMLHIATGAGIINEGLLRINQTASVFDTRLFYDADLGGTVLAGSGTVELNGAGDPPDARIVVSTGTTLDISQPVSGTGMIEVQGTGLVNMSAPITANVSGQDLRITGSMNLVGGGTLEAMVLEVREPRTHSDEDRSHSHGNRHSFTTEPLLRPISRRPPPRPTAGARATRPAAVARGR